MTFGGIAATNVTALSPTSVTCITPANSVGVVDVVLTSPGGSATKVAAYNYVTKLTYTVTYHGNGSSGGAVPVDGNNPHDNGASVTVLGNTGTLVRTGYTFAGWNTSANGSGTAYTPGATFTINQNTTLYAR